MKGVSNQSRRQMREKFEDPRCPPLHVPKPDKNDKGSAHAGVREPGQNFGEPVGLTFECSWPNNHNEREKGSLTAEKATNASRMALHSVGNINASEQMAREKVQTCNCGDEQ